ncbi:MAG TPA: hypothetical protein VFZ22_12290 [Pyrinomonadaceae bacterium]|nr:hypothetical protein [Pyrinomonadaceae bacterium]
MTKKLKKAGFGLVLVAIVIGAGYASTRFRQTKAPFTAHTIVYRATHYDESENVIETDTIVRQVSADGTWRHTIIRQDGSVTHTGGKLAGPLTDRQTDAASPRHLGHAYYEDRQKAPSWISSELQDFLMFTALRSDGSKQSKIEAIDISTP